LADALDDILRMRSTAGGPTGSTPPGKPLDLTSSDQLAYADAEVGHTCCATSKK
jgi:hypothetical protein